MQAANDAILLAFADETSIVQTRFATTALALLRAHLGHDLGPAIADAQLLLDQPLPAEPADFEHFVFLGHGWTVGLASEAALKFREAGQAWAEAYPAMEYRHGPISVAGPGTLAWFCRRRRSGPGSRHSRHRRHRRSRARPIPWPSSSRCSGARSALAEAKGLDPDNPQHLTRSVVLG